MTKRILLVDDDPAVLRSTARVLEQAGHIAVTAVNQRAAWFALGAYDTDCIVCDGDLGDGSTGAQIYRQLNPAEQARFLAYTGSPDLFQGLPIRVIQKPNIAALLDAVREVVGAQKSTQGDLSNV